MKKVLIIVDNICRGAGTERAAINLAEILMEQGYTVSIVSIFTSDGHPFFSIDPKINIIHLATSRGKQPKIWYYLRLIKRLKQSIKTSGSKIIIGTTYVINILLPFVARKGLHTIGCEHVTYDVAPWYAKIIRRLIYPRINRIIVLTESDKKRYKFLKQTTVIPNSLPYKTEKQSLQDNHVIISVGRLNPVKRLDEILYIAATLKPMYKDWKFRIIGDGESKDELISLSKKMHIDDIVEFLPPQKNIIQEFFKSDIFVLTSKNESFALVIVEAMECGLPVAAYSSDGPSSIIENGTDGILVENGDRTAMTKAIASLIDDKQKRLTMGKNAKIKALQYSKEKISEHWKDLFEELI